MGILARVAACTIALLACAMPGARAYTHARDIGLTAVVTPSTTSATRGEDVDVYGLNFSPGSSAAASIPGQLVCVFGSSPGNTSVGAVITGTTGVRCAAPTTFEGFVALGLSSNGGVDAVLFHELGMSSVLNFVREAKGMLTRASPNVATRGDVVRLTGRNAAPLDGRANIVGAERECEWRGATSGFEASYSGMGVYVSSALVLCEVPKFANPSSATEEASMYAVGENRVALVERVDFTSLNITSADYSRITVEGGVAIDATVIGKLGVMFTDDGAPYVRFGTITVAASASNAYTITVISPAMAASASIPIWVAAVPSTNSGVPSYGTTLAVGEDYYGVLERYESTTMPTTYRWIADPAPTMSITLKCVSQGVGETATSTNNVCVHSNQLATGFVAVMMSYDGAVLPRSGEYDSAAAMKVVATPTTSSMTPARGPAEGGALTWVSGSNLHESIRAGDGWVPRCSFGVDTSGSSMGTFVSSALIACETPYIGTTTSSAQAVVAGSSLSAIASGPKYSFMANTLVTQHSIVPHLGPIYGGTRVVFTLSTDVSATSMTSCRFGTVVVNGWSPLVYTDITADAGIMCVAPALAVGTYSIGLGTVRGSIGDSTTSPFTLGGLAYQVYSEY